jgi:hypothetical protein
MEAHLPTARSNYVYGWKHDVAGFTAPTVDIFRQLSYRRRAACRNAKESSPGGVHDGGVQPWWGMEPAPRGNEVAVTVKEAAHGAGAVGEGGSGHRAGQSRRCGGRRWRC